MNLHIQVLPAKDTADFRLLVSAVGEGGENLATIASMDRGGSLRLWTWTAYASIPLRPRGAQIAAKKFGKSSLLALTRSPPTDKLEA